MQYSNKEMYKNLAYHMPPMNLLYLVFMVAIGILVTFGFQTTAGTIIGIVIIVVVLGLHIHQVVCRKKFNNKLKEAINGSEGESLLMDYNNSQGPYINSVRLGDRYLYSDGNGLIDYNEISRIFEQIQLTATHLEDKRFLKLIMKNGNEITIGKPLTNGRSDEETAKIVSFVLSKNPNVELNKDNRTLAMNMAIQDAAEKIQKKHSEANK